MRLAILVPPAEEGVDWRWAFDPQEAALRAGGIHVVEMPWTDPGDLTGFDLVTPLLVWGYHKQYDRWTALLDRLERKQLPVANPVPVLRWNSDKAYLAELGGKGVSTVPSIVVDALDEAALDTARERFGQDRLVVKPLVSASAYGTYPLSSGDPIPEQVLGWRMLVQPWLEAITDAGEYSLIYFDGAFSHSVSKVPRPGEFRVQPEYGGIIRRCDPPSGSLELAQAAIEAAPAACAYARVDLVVGNDGSLQVIELELIEPALFMAEAPDSGPAFARAMRSAAERAAE
jgi:glutathione synthase/RimK-type ligase-like ATP-grasp enzyme